MLDTYVLHNGCRETEARALIGKEVGASAEVTTPKGTRYYEVEKISFI